MPIPFLIPGLAALGGAGLGAWLSSGKSSAGQTLFGKEGEFKQAPIYTKEQLGQMQKLQQLGMNQLPALLRGLNVQQKQSYPLPGGRNPALPTLPAFGPQFRAQEEFNRAPQYGERFDFDPIAQAEISRFQSQLLPQIAEQFAGQGANSNLLPTLGQATAGLSERLAGLRSQYGLEQQAQDIQREQLAQQGNLNRLQLAQQYGLERGKAGLLGALEQRKLNQQLSLGREGAGQTANLERLRLLTNLIQGLSGAGLQPQSQTAYAPGTQGLVGQAASSLPYLLPFLL